MDIPGVIMNKYNIGDIVKITHPANLPHQASYVLILDTYSHYELGMYTVLYIQGGYESSATLDIPVCKYEVVS